MDPRIPRAVGDPLLVELQRIRRVVGLLESLTDHCGHDRILGCIGRRDQQFCARGVKIAELRQVIREFELFEESVRVANA